MDIIELVALTVAPLGDYTSIQEDYPVVYAPVDADSFRPLPAGMANKLYRNISTTPVLVDPVAFDLGLLKTTDELVVSGVKNLMSESNIIGPNSVTLAKVWTTYTTAAQMIADGVHVPLWARWRDAEGPQDISLYYPDTTPANVVGDALMAAFKARMNALGYTDTQVAAFFGVTVPQFVNYVTNHTRAEFVNKLREAFNAP